MRNLIYFILCVVSIVITAYMVFVAWQDFQLRGFALRNIAWIFGTFGWLLITYKIVMKSYNWTKKLCK